ncbi:chorismate mutase [Bdellovibrio sp. NC01]|uniref:chorismate mutase n=1 Tax=Bdellovibrio sp. NC01 TaxID=2220073 RepID=UPI001158D03E|nr:chorismate mutase [Bdellovibrio sp. NC01]QDK37983.1 hypothetical protein DOE51_10485 [Bdellovibrio sp. NC01]
MSNIPELRQEIDQIHKDLHALLLRRRELTMAIWKIKQEQGLPFFNAEREEQIVADFMKMGMGEGQPQDPQFEELLKGVMNSLLREFEKYLKSKYSPKS